MSRRHRAGRTVRVGVIGAGLGGIATAVRLKQSGLTSFTVFERASGPGGVWWHNTYPGCEVDVPSQAYSYSFMPYVWPRTHASQAELCEYVDAVLDHFDVRSHFRFDEGVKEVRWSDATATYTVTTTTGAREEFDVVVSCLGMLSEANEPTWPGLDEFDGPVFHTSAYRHDIDLTGQRVAVVGTGSTACQLAPALAPLVGHLDLYQREPGYVLPKRSAAFTAEQQERYRRHPLRYRVDRYRLFWEAIKARRAFDVDHPEQQKIRTYAHEYIKGVVSDVDTQRALTPTYPFGCKRPVFASGYYKMFNRDDVELVPHAVEKVTAQGLIDELGIERPADVIILATGFKATRYQSSLEVIGPSGRRLHDVWGNEPVAFLGMTVPSFPNFFMLYGPNSNGGWSIISTLERQTEALGFAVSRLERRPGTVIETRRRVAERYDAWVQRRLAKVANVSEAGCHNYYHAETGKNVTQLPLSAPGFYVATKLLSRLGWTRVPAPSG